MTPKRWKRIKELFEAALRLPADERQDFVVESAGDDSSLIEEVTKLLESHEIDDSFLENPISEDAPTMISETNGFENRTDTVAPGEFVAGTVLDKRYRIIGLLGKGGMGEVFKAEDLKLNQLVALKFLPKELERNQDALDRFVSEVRTARKVSHANVCKVYDIGEIDGKHFLSMEFIEGDDLSQLLNRIGRLPSDKAAEISRQVCFGLNAIHESGILHRDLKPANVIIDADGKARITDFGIAGIEKEISKDEIRVGTPAYMSPEQISGKEVTPRSDIYSLGLLLYEIYSGKQAFSADSFPELVEKHQGTQPTNVSVFVENLDPIVEKTINRCLEKRPTDRPQTALEVALALPGGDPLQAAILAGETPSPEMVAASGKEGALSFRTAALLSTAVLILFGLFAYAQQQSKIFNLVEDTKPKEVLAERAREISRELGYESKEFYETYGFRKNSDHYSHSLKRVLTGKESHDDVRERIRGGYASYAEFMFRQSPGYLVPNSDVKVTFSDPPLKTPGESFVSLTLEGRLLRFTAVPAISKDGTSRDNTDWNKLFELSGLNSSDFDAIESDFTPPIFADERRAWKGTVKELPGVVIQVEAASRNGKPVYFGIVAPWNNQNLAKAASSNSYRDTGVFLLILIHLLAVLGSVFLARRNLQNGRADLKGSLRLATLIFIVFFLQRLLAANHVPDVWGELSILYFAAARAVFAAIFTSIVYLALEPYVRRFWSELLISWSRLFAGEFQDPLVGRDILVGFLFGLGHTFGIFAGSIVFALATGNSGVLSDVFLVEPINGTNETVSGLLGMPANAISQGFLVIFVLLGCFLITKRKDLSGVMLFLLSLTIQGLIFVLPQHWSYAVAAFINATCLVFIAYKFGLLSVIAFWIGFYITYLSPLTLDSANPFFPNTVVTTAVVVAIVSYGFLVSTGGTISQNSASARVS